MYCSLTSTTTDIVEILRQSLVVIWQNLPSVAQLYKTRTLEIIKVSKCLLLIHCKSVHTEAWFRVYHWSQTMLTKFDMLKPCGSCTIFHCVVPNCWNHKPRRSFINAGNITFFIRVSESNPTMASTHWAQRDKNCVSQRII